MADTFAAIQWTRSLLITVTILRQRDRTLARLQGELEGLVRVLGSLAQVPNAPASMLVLLESPIDRCRQLCCNFKQLMEAFSETSKMISHPDWTKMEVMGSNINEFIDTMEGYKSTISVAQGIITLHTSKVPIDAFHEMVEDTAYNLELHLQRTEEIIERSNLGCSITSDMNIDLQNEQEATKQCLQICEYARHHIESLDNPESSTVKEVYQVEDDVGNGFGGQLDIGNAIVSDGDQVIVATSPGKFIIGDAISSRGSAQLLGRMPEDILLGLVDSHYTH